MEIEEWKWIPGFEGKYEASTLGRVRSHLKTWHPSPTPHLLNPKVQKSGDYKISFGREYQEWLHRLIAKTFVLNPHSLPFVNHISGDKSHNRPSNLEWVSNSENAKHAYRIGLNKGVHFYLTRKKQSKAV